MSVTSSGTGPETMWTVQKMRSRLVYYDELVPCLNAFVDSRTPGSAEKENFTIIGPGVSENPEQHVHIAEPHGFNIGGARQPPGCVNSQHSHETAELFVVHTGHWSFTFGEHGDDARVLLNPGDIVSIPTRIFRGFTNVGDDVGYLWAVLGSDDPGRVTWSPHVFDIARDHGLVLLETGQLVDTVKGQTVPDGARPMVRTSASDVAAMRRIDANAAERCVVRAASLGSGWTSIISSSLVAAHFPWPHGFAMHQLQLEGGHSETVAAGNTAVVIFVHIGCITFDWDGGSLPMTHGDTISVPVGVEARVAAHSGDAVLFFVRADAAV